MSSIKQITPSKPSKAKLIRFWNNSGADEIPKGKRLKQNLPKGVMNVVNKEDCFESSICQNPESSILLKILALHSWASVWSTNRRICLSRLTHLFSCVRSTQIHTFLFGLGTTTKLAHQSVGPSTLVMMFCCSILSSSSFTYAISGKEIRPGVVRPKGVALSDNLMSYSPCNFPNPVKSCGNLEITPSLSNLMSQTLATRLRLVIAGSPNNGVWRFFTT